MPKLIDGLTPIEWLKVNYNLRIGNRVVCSRKTGIIINILPTDNVGHNKTNYPVVLVVDFITGEPEKITIEGIHGF